MSFFSLVRAEKSGIIVAGLAGAVSVFLGLVFLANGYSVQTDFLVMQKSAEKQDFYTLSKSVEYSGNILKEAIASDLFFEEASKTGYFNANAFSSNERDRLKEWRKAITVSQRSGAGILSVTVKRVNRSEATGIARAVGETLIAKNNLFRSGEEDSISIKTISGPIVEQNPTMSELIAGVVAGLAAGAACALLWMLRSTNGGWTVSEKKESLYFENEQVLNDYQAK